jgi:hypothetical protein
MTAVEFAQECILFSQFGKIQDIDFDMMLHNEGLSDGTVIRAIDFDNNQVMIGEWYESDCPCCGSYVTDEMWYDLDYLAKHGYLSEVIDMMDQVLKNKTGV